MKTISRDYLALLEQKHRESNVFGANGGKWVQMLLPVLKQHAAETVLDYGCGRGGLKNALRRFSPVQVQNYDPAVPEFAVTPEPADVVVCTDVLEHIEPELLTNVLLHIEQLMKKAGFFNISTAPAMKTLADGRNAHLIVQDGPWWFEKVSQLFKIDYYNDPDGKQVIMVVEKLK